MGVQDPAGCEAAPLSEVTDAGHLQASGAVDRCLIFTPDAIGKTFIRRYDSLFLRVRQYAPIEVSLRSVVPPKTPVCYASMFTGARPQTHGITEYVRRAPACESIFDVLDREGLSAAIVAVEHSTMDTIFRPTGVDHFTEAYDEAVFDRTLELIEADKHNLIVAYQQEYDDTLHREHPESAGAMEAVRRHVESFASLAAALKSAWSAHRYLIAFSPDHGAHHDPATGTGTHGDDVPDDMEVTHFFGFGPEARLT